MPMQSAVPYPARGRSARRVMLTSAALSLALVAAVAAVSHRPADGAVACPDLRPDVTVTAAAPADADAACRGAGRALAFLAGHGITADRPIRIVVADSIGPLNGAPVAGTYDRRTGIVSVLARDAFADGPVGATVLSMAMDDDLYASVFAHEVAHAVIDQHTGDRTVGPAAHEYVAYTVQLATLPVAVRSAVLDRLPGAAFGAPAEINPIILAMAPHRFAAKAYRHYRGAGSAPETLDAVLAMPAPPIDMLD